VRPSNSQIEYGAAGQRLQRPSRSQLFLFVFVRGHSSFAALIVELSI
jgi:hypothetical protein